MKLSEIHSPSIKPLRQPAKRKPLIDSCRSDDSDFCRELALRYHFTAEQVRRAAERYRLGRSKSGKCIFWMIDELGRVLDGHIGEGWVSVMMKAREPGLLADWHAWHCLFGLHLINETKIQKIEKINLHNPKNLCLGNKPVAVVESEKSAVILSELFPEYVWMAAVSVTGFTIDRLEPLKGRKVILFPDTDETMSNYVYWLELADMARRLYRLDITVSDLLERNASPGQKQRKIDLVDYLFP